MHRIRHSRNAISPHGRPFNMYFTPEAYNTTDFLHPADPQEIEARLQECRFKSVYPCDEDVFNLCVMWMAENNWQPPSDPENARNLFIRLREKALEEF